MVFGLKGTRRITKKKRVLPNLSLILEEEREGIRAFDDDVDVVC